MMLYIKWIHIHCIDYTLYQYFLLYYFINTSTPEILTHFLPLIMPLSTRYGCFIRLKAGT